MGGALISDADPSANITIDIVSGLSQALIGNASAAELDLSL
jgi:hypothetical protein